MDLNFCGKQPRAEHCGCTIDYLSRAGYPILNGSCLHLGSEHPGWFHTQREQSCLGKKLGHKYAYYGVNTSKHRASVGFACCRPCGLARTGEGARPTRQEGKRQLLNEEEH